MRPIRSIWRSLFATSWLTGMLLALALAIYRTPETWAEARGRLHPAQKVGRDTSAEAVIGRVMLQAALCVPSLAGLVALIPLFTKSLRPKTRTVRLLLIDVVSLPVILAVSFTVWSKYPGVVRVGFAHLVAAAALAIGWWCYSLVVMAHAGVASRLHRGVLQIVVVPGAFLSPCFVGIIVLGWQTAHGPSPAFSWNDVSLLTCAVVFVAGIRIVWIIRDASDTALAGVA